MPRSVERSFILEGISHSILKEFNKDPPLPPHHTRTHKHTVAVRDSLAISFAFRPGAGGPIQSILKLKASILGSSFLPSTQGVLGGGGHGALFMGVDSCINQKEIAAGEGGGRSTPL